ncbi:MAG: patatin-like phospholipase family protein [Pseudolysinimonas sp.]|uniref:patatin-like phospholipase family protein n=1 Tax=Pseudolysinimonas sp. TaxID=2680009 RepID=UPI0032647F76
MTTRALVLGGGGVTGVAWETGLLLGLERQGIRLQAADLLVGTSAGSVVAAQISGTTSLDDLYRAQLDGFAQELPSKLGLLSILSLVVALRGTKDERQALAKVGARALRTTTVSEESRRAVIAQRLPVHTWPARALKIPAIDAITGEFTVFDSSSGVDLVDAVAASCAVPMVWPPVTIASRRYIDGGMRSVANVDLAAGFERVLVIAPVTTALRRGGEPAAQLAALHTLGSALVAPDREARAAMGSNSLDPRYRAASAAAGLAQASRVADTVAAAWG